MKFLQQFIGVVFLMMLSCNVFGQQKNEEKPIKPAIDSVAVSQSKKTDTTTQKIKLTPEPHSPKKATIRSAILPGWGQAYNKEYWKIPLVYAAIGTTAYIFIDNNNWYKRTRDAYVIRFNKDTANFGNIHPDLTRLTAEDLRYYRNEFRRNRDYSVVAILIAWGLNVVDATVFGHLKAFDVSEDLSLKINPSYNPLNRQGGLSLVLSPRTPPKKILLPTW